MPLAGVNGWHRPRQAEREQQPRLTAETADLGSDPAGVIRPVWSAPGWIPVADDSGGSFLVLDLSPGPAGTPGQVFALERSGGQRVRVAESLGASLAMMTGEYERGNADIFQEDADRVLTSRAPPAEHFLDAAPLLFGTGRKPG